ncbi:MAG: restriction endonuclease subunit S [Pseudomonadales bacterium]|nr:restriction endonuclease subunit S [Pseudomonadales bacterium]
MNPSNWETWKLSHAYPRIGSGTTPTSTTASYYSVEEGVPWVTTAELRENYIDKTASNVTTEALQEFSALRTYKPGSLMIAMYGATIGRLGITTVPATCNQACCVFEYSKQFDNRFLFYWLWHRRADLIALSTGGGQPNLSQQDLREERAYCPPLETQRHIAQFLDEKTARIDGLIEKKRALLERLAEKRQALITRAVTKGLNPDAPMKPSGIDWLGDIPAHWDCKRLRFAMRTNPSKREITLNDDELVSFVPMEAVGEYGGLNLESEKQLIDVGDGYTYFANYDVVIAKITPCFENAKGALAKDLKNGVAFGTTELHVMRANENLSPEYLFYISMSYPFAKLGESEMFGSGGQKRVPEGFIKNFRMGLPSIDEQHEIIEYVNRVNGNSDLQASKTFESVERLSEYHDALITAAVTGQIGGLQ